MGFRVGVPGLGLALLPKPLSSDMASGKVISIQGGSPWYDLLCGLGWRIEDFLVQADGLEVYAFRFDIQFGDVLGLRIYGLQFNFFW